MSHEVLFASADWLERFGMPYRLAYSGKELRCLVISPENHRKAIELMRVEVQADDGRRYPIVVNTQAFRQHVIRQAWRLSEWQ